MVRRIVVVAFAVLVGAGVQSQALDAQGLMITEIMAGPHAVLADQDGDFSDWIEILNAGAAPVSLAGYSLTDDAGDLRKWVFPDVTLGPGRFLVVFASEKDRARVGSELHTNFRLEEEGEVLGLVAPDGATVVSKFDPHYPPQTPRFSYGAEMEASETKLVAAGAAARFLVPSDASAGAAWTGLGFDDAAWEPGTTGLGFDKKEPATFTDLIQTSIQAQLDTVNAVAFIRIPFTVADPSAVSGLILKVRYDDGFTAYLNGVEVARRNAPAAIAHTSRATVRRVEADVLVAEEINIGAHAAALVPGSNVLAIAGLNVSRLDSDFLVLPELSAVSVQSVAAASQRYFSSPTPGLPNSGGAPDVAAAPRFSRAGGLFSETFGLVLEAGAGATVRYTVNGTEPTEASTLHEGPITVDKNMIVKAKAYAPGVLPSRTLTEFYVLTDATVSGFSSNLPIVIIETFGRGISDAAYTNAYAMVIDVDAGGRSAASAAPAHASPAALKIRGSSSLQFPKKSYTFEIQDAEGGDEDVSLLGMPPESDWVLYAPYTDKTLIRDVLAYEWSNWIGRYAARTRLVEAFVRTSNSKLTYATGYVGVYVLSEKLKRNEERINIQRLHASQIGEPDVSGGYIWKKDRLDPGDTGLSAGGHTLGWVDPKEKEAPAAQRAWIQKYLNEFAGALNGPSFAHPENGYAKYIDVGSFIDHHILVELTKNIDGYRLSTFMFKDREGKLNMGPIWDYNLTLGNANYLDGWKADGWYYSLVGGGDYPWYGRLQQDPAFVRRYKERWTELRRGPLQLSRLLESVDAKVQLLAESQVRNYRRWPILGTYVWPNWFIGRTYEEEIGFLRDWLEDRVAWMDGQLVPAPEFSQDGGQVASDFQLAITSPTGTNVAYTTDGTDPRLDGGAVSPSALQYTGPIQITRNTRVTARTMIGDEVWGGMKAAVFVVEMPPVVVTEVMYAPAPPPDGSPFSVHDFEFVEIKNIGTEPHELRGLRFKNAMTFDFANSAVAVIAPGAHALVVRNLSAFESRYGAVGMNVAGRYTGDLSNTADTVVLEGPVGEQLNSFRYAATWYPETRDTGLSIVIADATAPRETWGVKEGWRPSNVPGGSPGADDPDQPAAGLQVPGDFTQDGILGLTDATNLLGYLYLGEPAALPCVGIDADRANVTLLDADADGELRLTDAVHVLIFLFRGGPPPILGESCVPITGCADACAAP